MTIADLIRELRNYPPEAKVFFATKDWCPEGYPEWVTARVVEIDGEVVIKLDRLREEME